MLRAGTCGFFSIIVVLVHFSACELSIHKCIHDDLKHSTVASPQEYRQRDRFAPTLLRDEEQQFLQVGLQLNETEPLRLLIDTSLLATGSDSAYSCYNPGQVIDIDGSKYQCRATDILTTESRDYLENTLLKLAKEKLAAALYTIPVSSNLMLQGGYKCGFQGGIDIPTDYTTIGIPDTDVVIFVTARPITTPHVLAFGGECQSDQGGRPIAGHLNISPVNVQTSAYEQSGQLGMVMHEMTHVLGFSVNKVGWNQMTSTATKDGSTRTAYKVSSPTVMSWVRTHFNCSSIDGAELEDAGADGTRLSHWEKRVFMNEYMTGQSTPNPVFSGLTLALFQDSGWYSVDFSKADHLVYGASLGCQIPFDSCSKWTASSGYFCRDPSERAPTFDLQAKGKCDIDSRDPSPPASYQYYGANSLGGPSALADWCGYVSADSTGWCTDARNGDVINGELVKDGEKFCDNCRVLRSSLILDLPVGGDLRMTCYETACVGTGQMKVRVDDLWYDCTADQRITIEGYGGYVQCPDSATLGSLCSLNSIDKRWPVVSSVSPRIGRPGINITVTGTAFDNVRKVMIDSIECENVQVLSSTTLVVSVPYSVHFASPSHLIRTPVDLTVVDDEGRMGLGRNVLDLRIDVDAEWVSWFLTWLAHHWLQIICAFVVVAVATVIHHYRTKKG